MRLGTKRLMAGLKKSREGRAWRGTGDGFTEKHLARRKGSKIRKELAKEYRSMRKRELGKGVPKSARLRNRLKEIGRQK